MAFRLPAIARFAVLMTSALVTMVSCNDADENLGSSLVEDHVNIVVYQASAPEGESVLNPDIQSRTTRQLLGRLHAENYGSFSSEIVTQFMSASVIDTKTLTPESVDSVKLLLEMPRASFVGDSIVPMGLNVYRLTKQLPAPIYSNFNPEGFYDPQVYASTYYAPSGIGMASDSTLNQSTRQIAVKLPLEFGKEIIKKYQQDPAMFNNPTAFTNWFPGFYIANSFGSGRVVGITNTSICLYSGGKAHKVMTVSPEVVNNNDMSYEVAESIKDMISEGKTLLIAPVGYNVNFTMPTKELFDHYRSSAGSLSVVNSLTLEIPAVEIANDFGIKPPQNLLLVRKSKLQEFFNGNTLPDNIFTFTATYDSSSKSYKFTNLHNYFNEILKLNSVTAEDTEFVLTPVTINEIQYQTVSYQVLPYIAEPAMVQLDLQKAVIKLTYTKQTVK